MKKILFLLCVCTVLFSCKKKEDDTEQQVPTPVGNTDYSHGSFFVNEGSFGANNAGVSYLNTSDGMASDIYLQVNGVELGDILSSFTVVDDKGYFVVNNSQKIEIVDMVTMQHRDVITGLDYPRYMVRSGQKAYVSNGSFAGDVKVIDLATNDVVGSIAVGNGPEKMVISGNYLFVCNSGGWDLDNSVSVIDLTSGTVVSTITVGDRPMDAVVDINGDVWVMCSGNDSWMVGGETLASVYLIDGSTRNVEGSEVIGSAGIHPKNITASPNGATIYYENDGVFALNITDDFPGTEIINAGIGSLDVDSNGDIWCATVSDFVNPSTVNRFSSSGTLKASWEGGLGTNAVVFN